MKVVKLWELRPMQSLEYVRSGISEYLPVMVFQVLEKNNRAFLGISHSSGTSRLQGFPGPPTFQVKIVWKSSLVPGKCTGTKPFL